MTKNITDIKSLILIGLLITSYSFANLRREVVFYGQNSPGPYALPDRFILIASDSVFINDTLQSKDVYQLDYEAGTILFTYNLTESTKVLIHYQRIPFLNPSPLFRFRLESDTESIVPPINNEGSLRRQEESLPTDDGELMISGSKTLGFSVGSEQGLGIEQATRLQVSGGLSGVEIEAALSDQSSPISPEGTTKEITELDKIWINIRSGGLNGTFGDYDLATDFGRWGAITRRGSGVQIKGNFDKKNFQCFFTRPKGKFRRLIFNGKDGIQGPYRLTGEESFISIVPASEVVYLNGERMNRGWDEDYTIDYSSAELTFTNKRIITSNTRIEVNYEYTFDAYYRSALGLSGRYQLSPFYFGTGIFQESDNQNQSLAYTLGRADIESLSVIGDDTSRAWLDGGKFVGQNQGDYRKIGDHYVYAGRNLGDYDVTFTYVGDSLGDYIYDDSIYVYIGANQGQYVAKRRIILPQKTEIYSSELGMEMNNGLNLNLTGSISLTDQNLFSAFADENNRGFGYGTELFYEKSSYRIGYKRKYTSVNFTPLLKNQEIDFSYHWGDLAEMERLTSDEIFGFIKPFDFFTLDGSAGWLLTPKKERQKRLNLGTKLFWAGYQLNRVADILRQNLTLSPTIKSFSPKLAILKEDRTSLRRLAVSPQLGFTPKANWRTTFSFEQEKTTFFSSGQNENLRRLYKFDLDAKPITNFIVNGVLGFQQFQSLTGDWQQYFADLASNFTLPKGLSLRIDHHRTNQQSEMKQERFIPVDSGTGNYRRNPETGTFFPDSNGDYKRIVEPTGIMGRSQRQDWQANCNFTMFEYWDFNGFLNFTAEASDTEQLFRIYNHNARFGIFPMPKAKRITFYLINNYDSRVDYRYTQERSWQNQNGFEVWLSANENLSLKTGLEYNLIHKEFTITRLLNRATERKISFEPYVGYNLDLELFLSQSWRDVVYTGYDKFQLRVTVLGVRRYFRLKKDITLSVKSSLTRRTADVTDLPFEISFQQPLGITPEINLNFDQILSKELVFSAGYNFIDRPNQRAEHSLSANLRAYF